MSQYVHVGIILITVPNLILIILMLLVFAVAIFLPLPELHSKAAEQVSNQPAEPTEGSK
jgi:hypothetical protein